jgi:hypothetical protein
MHSGNQNTERKILKSVGWVQEVGENQVRAFHDDVCFKFNLFLNYAIDPDRRHTCTGNDYFPIDVAGRPRRAKAVYDLFTYLTDIKDTYVTARSLFVQSQIKQSEFAFLHIPASDRMLFPGDDRAGFDINLALLKTAFTTAYTVFDKVAFLVHWYFDGSLAERQINFRSIFVHAKTRLHVAHSQHTQLTALNDIRLDLDEYYPRITALRNSLVHKYLVIHGVPTAEVSTVVSGGKERTRLPEDSEHGNDARDFHVTDDELFELTVQTLKLARSALLCTTILIKEAEKGMKDGVGQSPRVLPPVI